MKGLAFLILCFASVVVFADDFKTIDGKEYKNAKVSRVEPDGIVLITKSGISKVYFAELSKEVQEHFNYDPEKAAAYASEQNAQLQMLRNQQKEAQQKRAEESARYWGEHRTPAAQAADSVNESADQQGHHGGVATRNKQESAVIPKGVKIGPGTPPVRTLQQLEADQFSMIGQIIGAQFNLRSTSTHRVDPNWFSGRVRRYDRVTTTRSMFESAEVLIPANALSWFQAIPTDYSGARETVVYAQVENDRSGGTVLRLVGTQIRREMNGNGEIGW